MFRILDHIASSLVGTARAAFFVLEILNLNENTHLWQAGAEPEDEGVLLMFSVLCHLQVFLSPQSNGPWHKLWMRTWARACGACGACRARRRRDLRGPAWRGGVSAQQAE